MNISGRYKSETRNIKRIQFKVGCINLKGCATFPEESAELLMYPN